MTTTEPSSEVEDWATDFDILDSEYVADPAMVWGELREQCPIAHTDRYGSTWLPTRYDDLAEIVQSGKIDFDRCIATPDMMPLVGRLGKVLGPRGLMPNPKVGTVTPDVAEAVKAAKGGAVEFRVEKAGIVHAGVGKASFSEDQILGNVRALIDAVQKAKPAGAKGTYIKRIAISSTMGPGVKVEPQSVAAGA